MQKTHDSYGSQGLAMPMFVYVGTRIQAMQGENHQRQEFRILALFLPTIMAQQICLQGVISKIQISRTMLLLSIDRGQIESRHLGVSKPSRRLIEAPSVHML